MHNLNFKSFLCFFFLSLPQLSLDGSPHFFVKVVATLLVLVLQLVLVGRQHPLERMPHEQELLVGTQDVLPLALETLVAQLGESFGVEARPGSEDKG